MTLVFIDVETTGLNPQENSIFQISGLIKKGSEEETFDFRMKPYRREVISPEASEKTGISQEELDTYPDQKLAYNNFISLLDKYDIGKTYQDKAFFIGYNASFDMDFVRSWFEFNENLKFGYRFWFPYIDVMQFVNLYLIGERALLRNFQLSTVYQKLFGKSFEDAHNSLADIKATQEIFNFVAGKFLLPLVEIEKPKIQKRVISPKS